MSLIKFDDKIHKLNFGIGEIGYDGQVAIHQQLTSWGYPYLPDWWQWIACVPRGKYSGTFIKRLSKYYHNEGITFKQEHASSLGSMIGKYTLKNEDFYFRFTDQDWKAGDFGDRGSCFWTERTYNRLVLRHHGMKAVQFFRDSKGEKGYARAFLIAHPAISTKDWLLFNGYGIETIKIARIVSQFLGVPYREISLVNEGESQGSLYFNNDGQAFVLSRNIKNYTEPPDLTEVELNIPVYKLIKHCKYCDEYILKENLTDGYCEECLEDTIECPDCNTRIHNESSYEVKNHKLVCYTCYTNKYVICNRCAVADLEKNLLFYKNSLYCESCIKIIEKETKAREKRLKEAKELADKLAHTYTTTTNSTELKFKCIQDNTSITTSSN